MEIFEIMLTEAHHPLDVVHIVKKKDIDHLCDPSFNEGMDINSFLYNTFHEFGTCYATYGIKLPIKSEWRVNQIVILPDMIKNNVHLIDGYCETMDDTYVAKLTFMGYCRGCKVTFLADIEKEEEGDQHSLFLFYLIPVDPNPPRSVLSR